jgi:hypothetical protein
MFLWAQVVFHVTRPLFRAPSIYAILPASDQEATSALMWVNDLYLVPVVSTTIWLVSPSERRLLFVNK